MASVKFLAFKSIIEGVNLFLKQKMNQIVIFLIATSIVFSAALPQPNHSIHDCDDIKLCKISKNEKIIINVSEIKVIIKKLGIQISNEIQEKLICGLYQHSQSAGT